MQCNNVDDTFDNGWSRQLHYDGNGDVVDKNEVGNYDSFLTSIELIRKQ